MKMNVQNLMNLGKLSYLLLMLILINLLYVYSCVFDNWFVAGKQHITRLGDTFNIGLQLFSVKKYFILNCSLNT